MMLRSTRLPLDAVSLSPPMTMPPRTVSGPPSMTLCGRRGCPGRRGRAGSSWPAELSEHVARDRASRGLGGVDAVVLVVVGRGAAVVEGLRRTIGPHRRGPPRGGAEDHATVAAQPLVMSLRSIERVGAVDLDRVLLAVALRTCRSRQGDAVAPCVDRDDAAQPGLLTRGAADGDRRAIRPRAFELEHVEVVADRGVGRPRAGSPSPRARARRAARWAVRERLGRRVPARRRRPTGEA